MKRLFIASIFTCVLSFHVDAQRNQNEFLEAKRLFNSGDYTSAISAFSDLKDDDTFGAYSWFYSGLSYFRSKTYDDAKRTWSDLLSLYPRWKNTTEVLYWLTIVSFETGDLFEALQYLVSYEEASVSSEFSKKVLPKYLSESNVEDLRPLYRRFPKNSTLAKLLATKITQQPYADRDKELLDTIFVSHGFQPLEVMDSNLENVFRSSYNVAVMLPFMFESLERPESVIRNKIVLDFYQGMILAQSDLDSLGKKITLSPYDTRKDFNRTIDLFGNVQDADLIVGPLYPDPIRAATELSKELKINMINPLSSNENYIGDNPMAFLYRPGSSTMARKLAEYAAENHDNPYALIYFGKNLRDSLFAEDYQEVLMSAGKEILEFRGLNELEAKALLDTLTDQYEEIYPKEIADSLAEIEGRFIKTRKLRKEEEEAGNEDPESALPFFFEEDEEGNRLENADKVVAYEMKFKVERDTVGSIFVASRSNTIVNNLLGALASREDSTGIYGYGDWFDFKVINYELFDQLDTKIAIPDFIRKDNYRFTDLEKRLKERFKVLPSDYHYHGYEFTYFIGNMLHKYGKYFQNGFYSTGYIPGFLGVGHDFRGANDNQEVPIVTIENFIIKAVDTESKSEE